jgi:hypothetical protein
VERITGLALHPTAHLRRRLAMILRHFAVLRTPRISSARRTLRPAITFLLGTLLLAAAPLHAQTTGKGFFFKQPAASLTLRGGFALGGFGGDSSIYAFTRRELTLGRGAYHAPSFGADLSIRLRPTLDLVLGAALAGSSRKSEMRDWVDQDDHPIEQTTSLKRVPLTASLKAYVTPRGRSIGQFAWIPARYAAYVGAGGGTMWYRFRQQGDFVDFNSPSLRVFSNTYSSSRWTPTAHVLAGVDRSLNTRLALTTEARYTWAKTEMGDDFRGFDRINLSGFSTTVGLNIRF